MIATETSVGTFGWLTAARSRTVGLFGWDWTEADARPPVGSPIWPSLMRIEDRETQRVLAAAFAELNNQFNRTHEGIDRFLDLSVTSPLRFAGNDVALNYGVGLSLSNGNLIADVATSPFALNVTGWVRVQADGTVELDANDWRGRHLWIGLAVYDGTMTNYLTGTTTLYNIQSSNHGPSEVGFPVSVRGGTNPHHWNIRINTSGHLDFNAYDYAADGGTEYQFFFTVAASSSRSTPTETIA